MAGADCSAKMLIFTSFSGIDSITSRYVPKPARRPSSPKNRRNWCREQHGCAKHSRFHLKCLKVRLLQWCCSQPTEKRLVKGWCAMPGPRSTKGLRINKYFPSLPPRFLVNDTYLISGGDGRCRTHQALQGTFAFLIRIGINLFSYFGMLSSIIDCINCIN